MFLEHEDYDSHITVFSPDGRLLQVEYALEAVYNSLTVMGISCLGGVVLAAEERFESRLDDPNFSQKIYMIDEHLGAAVAGITSDACILIDEARIYAQINRLMYGEPIYVESAARRVGDIMQFYTQHAGARPFGAAIIFGGIDMSGPRLFTLDPSGTYRSYRALTLGVGREAAERLLTAKYREDLKIEEAVNLALRCLMKTQAENKTVRIAVIPSETKMFRMLSGEEIKLYTGRLH